MATQHSLGLAIGFEVMRQVSGVDITYTRPGEPDLSVALWVVPGRSSHEVVQSNMVVEQVQSLDFIVKASEFILDGAVTLPQSGDYCEDEDGSVHSLLNVGGEPAWKYTDQTKQFIRLHFKQTG